MKEKIGILICYIIVAYTCIGCSLTKNYNTINNDKELISFLYDFEKVVLSHNSEEILEFIDKDYIKVQHDNFLEGRTNQFINEFFSGYIVNTQNYKTLQYSEIESLKRIELVKEGDYYKVSYEIYSKDIKIITNWNIHVSLLHRKRKFGLVGSYG